MEIKVGLLGQPCWYYLAIVAIFEDSVMNMRWTGCPWEVVKRLRKYLQCPDLIRN